MLFRSSQHLRELNLFDLDIPVEEIQLAEMLTLAADVELEREAAWRLFHLLGAALRNEVKAS